MSQAVPNHNSDFIITRTAPNMRKIRNNSKALAILAALGTALLLGSAQTVGGSTPVYALADL